MKKFMSTKAAASPVPPGSAPVAPVSPSDPTATFATFEALLRAANPADHPSPVGAARPKATSGSHRKVNPAPPPPTTPPAFVAVDLARRLEGSGPLPAAPASSLSTTSLAAPSPSSSATTAGVKMCGYLKKKRNKMGGWRKLFFILQNRLLLSYSSRDDYEKKLAPFKDIINLVPGTVIIPTTGPRFTIETNSKVLYTFRCDDQGSCSEWIMALLDSLKAVNGGLKTDRTFSPQNVFQRSTLPLASIALTPRATLFDRDIPPADAPPKPPRSFTAHGRPHQQLRRQTAQQQQQISEDALNNNVAPPKTAADEGTGTSSGASSSSRSSDNSTTRGTSDMRSRIMAFESHASAHPAQESVPAKDDTKDAGGRIQQQQQQEEAEEEEKGRQQQEGARREERNSAEVAEPEPDRWKWWLRGRQAAEKRPQEREEAGVLRSAREDASGPTEGEEPVDEDGEKLEKRRPARGDQQQQQQQQIFRLHPDAWRKTHQSMDVCRINSMFGERMLGVPAPESTGGPARDGDKPRQAAVEKRSQQANLEENGKRDSGARKPMASSCSALPLAALGQHEQPPAGTLTAHNSAGAATGSGREPEDRYAAEYADIRDYRTAGAELREAASEPIYAVVDICAKRSRRAARQHQQESDTERGALAEKRRAGPDRTSSFASVSLPQIPSATVGTTTLDAQRTRPVAKRCYSNHNDYEDVNDFLDRLEEGHSGAPRSTGPGAPKYDRAILYGDDHIYEPILVPERMITSDTSGSSTSLPASSSSGQQSSVTSSGGGLWKQLKRMHLQSSRHRLALRKVFAGGKATDGGAAAVNQSTSESEGDPGRTPSTLEGFGRRLDSHRRSIKKRIKSLYDRSIPGSTPVTSGSSTSSSSTSDEQRSAGQDRGTQEAVPVAFNRAQGSRQSRKSLSLDSFLSTKVTSGKNRSTPDRLATRLLIETQTK